MDWRLCMRPSYVRRVTDNSNGVAQNKAGTALKIRAIFNRMMPMGRSRMGRLSQLAGDLS